MAENIQVRHVGDTVVAIAVALKRPDGSAVNLAGKTVKFKMLNPDGTAKVSETADHVTVTDEAAGECQYDPQSADVSAVGIFYAYFVVYTGSLKDTFPALTGDLRIVIVGDVFS